MVNVTRGGGIDMGGSMPSMPNFRLAGSRILQLGLWSCHIDFAVEHHVDSDR